VPTHRTFACTGCGGRTVNRGRRCTGCINGGGPARLSWRAAHTLGCHLPEHGPRVVRLALHERCGGGTRRVADRADY
jgi:hypothetical protein